jgi:hypothetical protein
VTQYGAQYAPRRELAAGPAEDSDETSGRRGEETRQGPPPEWAARPRDGR